MNRSKIILLISIMAAALLGGCKEQVAQPEAVADEKPAVDALSGLAPVGATLLEGLGNYSRPIGSGHPDVQRWFDQGLMLTWGFNHQAAERSFLKAASLDPDCAMCWWGAALVLGPHVNAGMDPGNHAAAWERLQKALALAPDAEPWQRAWIEALAARYAENPPEDRTELDQAYAHAMAELVAEYPDDLDAATLYAESLMNLQPWSYWDDDGQPLGNTETIVSVLEGITARNADHAGALHLYIHAVEASEQPERGVAAADRLRTLIPGSGHLVHMPAHIYARVGRYHDAVIANQKAIEADNVYLAACRPGPNVYPLGYVPHNHHFLWFAATMGGQREIALASAGQTHARTSIPELMRTPGFEAMQNFSLTPLFADVRFGRWAAIQATDNPAPDLPYITAMWHYARGMAALRLGDDEASDRHYQALAAAAADPAIEAMMTWGRYSLIHGVRVAERTLAAERAFAAGRGDEAVEFLEQGVAIEDELPYDEPPGWHAPVRQTLGFVHLENGRPELAEAAYRAELRRNPDNGWSLFGLEQALRAQGRNEEADQVAQRFAVAWQHADFELTASRL